MKKITLPLITLAITAGLYILMPGAQGFSDVNSSHQNADAIAYVKTQGIVSGYEDGTYQPDKTINRAEFMKIVIESQIGQAPLEHAGSCFDDVASGVWYYPYICYAKRMEIVGGYPDGSFKPANEISFVEAAKIIVNSYTLSTPLSTSSLEDSEIWYRPFVNELANKNSIPLSITSFDQKITRGEMAEIIYRLETNVDKKSHTYNTLSGKEASDSLDNTLSYNSELLLSKEDLIALANNKYANGDVPIGDGKYTLDEPRKGHIYYCRELPGGGGAQVEGPWIDESTWNFEEKVSISGGVSWKEAFFNTAVSNGKRILTGNGLPTIHETGDFPISRSEEGYQYDRNPNSISATDLNLELPANPVYSETPYCMPTGQVGIMLSGVALYNGMDAEQRDAPAHEIQDPCNGHPQEHGQYHYHNLSPCLETASTDTVIGYAYDGFPITGPMVTDDKYLTTEDLDICHGITSEVTDENGNTYNTYHYVMTYDFPYSAGCYRSEPVNNGPQQQNQTNNQEPNQSAPPAAAFTACEDKDTNNSCSFQDNNRTITGTCRNVPEGFVCAP